MSEIKVNKLSPSTGTVLTLGDNGDTFSLPSGVTLTNNGTSTGFGSDGVIKYFGTASLSADPSITGPSVATDATYQDTGATITIPAADVVGLSKIINLTDGVGRQDANGAANITEFRTQRTAPSAVNYEATVSGANITTGLTEILYQRGSLIVDSSLGTGDHTYGVYFRKYAGVANQVNGIYFKQSGWRILAIGI